MSRVVLTEEQAAANADRMCGWFVQAGLTEAHAASAMEAMRDMVHLMAVTCASVPEAPNFITISYETADGHDWELTIRKHGGMAPSAKIAALEAECERLRARLADALDRRDAGP